MTGYLGTINQALFHLEKELADSSDSPNLDAQWLLLHIIKKTQTAWLLAHPDEKLNQKQIQTLEKLLVRRQNGEPLAYLIGEWEFYGRKFHVNKDVLIPRPETEKIIDKTLQAITKLSTDRKKITIADIGTGSGCIIITLALELLHRPAYSNIQINFVATDISDKALKTAKENAARHYVEKYITFLSGDILKSIKDRQIDLIVSNPPYLTSKEINSANRPENIGLRFEPRLALDGGQDGQKYVSALINSNIPSIIETTNGNIIKTPSK